MAVSILFGLALVIFSGIMMGCSILPMKYAIKWKWENIWMAFTGLAQTVLPLIVLECTVHRAWHVYGTVKTSALVSAVLLGFGWGVGNTLSGIGYTMLGIGLGTSVVLGVTAVVGSLLPLAIVFPGRLWSSSIAPLYIGVAVMLVGLGISAKAGTWRQMARAKSDTTTGADIKAFGKGDIRIGLIVCIVSGILSGMLNLALVFGDAIRISMLKVGALNFAAVNALWLPVEAAGFIPTLLYCIYLLRRDDSWSLYLVAGSHWLIALVMAAFFMAGLSLYGLGAAKLGEMGAIVAFPVFMSTVVVTGNIAGLLTGEWRGSPRAAYTYGLLGLLLLILSIVCIGVGKASTG